MASRRERWFTLIELLVVVAIIGLLAAILLPALANARGRAYTVRCLATERNIGLALFTFASDYDGRYPPMDDSTNPARSRFDFAGYASGTANPNWADWLLDGDYYTRDAFDCPSASSSRVGTGWFNELATDRHSDYLYNGFLHDNNGNLPGWHGLTHDDLIPATLIIQPSGGMFFMDGHGPGWNPVGIRPWMGHVFEHATGNAGDPPMDGRLRHDANRSMNLCYFDGHARTWNAYNDILFDSPVYDGYYGFATYSVYTGGSNDPTPVWRSWARPGAPWPWQ